MKEFFIENRKGLKMALRVTINEKNDKLVFLLHGIGARKEYPHMLVLEEEFAKHGFNVVNIDATDSLNASESSRGGGDLQRILSRFGRCNFMGKKTKLLC